MVKNIMFSKIFRLTNFLHTITARSLFSYNFSIIISNDHLPEKHFQTRPSKFKYINFRGICHQSINWSSIEILTKIDWESLKINCFRNFFETLVLLRFKEFHGLQDDLKIIWKPFNPWPSHKICPRKKRRLYFHFQIYSFQSFFDTFYSLPII